MTPMRIDCPQCGRERPVFSACYSVGDVSKCKFNDISSELKERARSHRAREALRASLAKWRVR